MLHTLSRGGVPGAGLEAQDLVWIDLENPSEAEELRVEALLGIDVPTLAERAAFEESARFYEDNEALFLTATLLGRGDDGPFVRGAVTFVLTNQTLVTVRQIRPRAFEIGQGRASARIGSAQNGADVLVALIEGASERLADLLAESGNEAVTLSTTIFTEAGPAPDLRKNLRVLGRIGTLTALAHESLSSLQQLLAFTRHACTRHGLDETRLAVLERDVAELERLAEAQQSRLSFLQDAALGLINAAQTDVLKALSLATIAFVPPTLVASIFGMNFKAMTWFNHNWGPWVGFALMALAPATLFGIAKWRRWF